MRSPAPTELRLRAVLAGVYATLLTFLLLATFVQLYGVNLPYWDEWLATRVYAAYDAGHLRWADLWGQHNEHRIPVPRLGFLFLYWLFGEWNLVSQMILNVLVMGMMIGALAYTVVRLRISPWVAVALAALLTSAAQWDNILFGYQMLAYALTAGIVVAVCAIVLDPQLRWRTIVLAIVGCAISMGSMVSGAAFWAAAGGTLAVRALLIAGSPRAVVADRRLRTRLAVFAVVAIAAVVFYVVGYERPPSVLHAKSVAMFIGWMARVLSSPFLDDDLHAAGMLCSALLWVAVAVAVRGYWRRRDRAPYRDRLVLFAGIGLTMFVNAGVTAFGRGDTPYVPSRYLTTLHIGNVLWLIAAADLARWSARSRRWLRRPAPIALAALVLALLLVHADHYLDGLAVLRQQGPDRRTAKEALAFYLSDHSAGLPLNGFATFPPGIRERGDLGTPTLTAVLPPDLQPPITAPPVEVNGAAWGADCAYERTAGPAPPAHWGSWRHAGPAATGIIRVGPIAIDRAVLQVPIAGFFGSSTGELRIEDAADPRRRIVYAGPTPGNTWASWNADVSPFIGREVVLVGVDEDTQLTGWFGFGRPRPMTRAMEVFDLALAHAHLAFCAVALAGLAILIVAADSRRLRLAVLASWLLLGLEATFAVAWLAHAATTRTQVNAPRQASGGDG